MVIIVINEVHRKGIERLAVGLLCRNHHRKGTKAHEGKADNRNFVAFVSFVVQDCLGGFVLLFIFRRASSQSLLRVSSRDLLVPGGVEGPRPGFADSSANHRLESARLADRAQVDVDENSAEA